MRYKRISDYGVVGDMLSAALIGIDGSIDWCCFPRFDSPSVFAAILDAEKGGKFQIAPIDKFVTTQAYIEDTNVLTTEFKTDSGTVRITDFMPCFMKRSRLTAFNEIHRRVETLNGNVRLRVFYQPRLNYGIGETLLESFQHGYLAINEDKLLALSSDIRLRAEQYGTAVGEFDLLKGESALFVVKYGERNVRNVTEYESEYKLSKTIQYWRNWVSGIKYKGRWRREVVRSALAIKLLQYGPTGAIVAAVTTSLPEKKGGSRNWDYRYSWIRDAAFALWALDLIGVTREALDYMKWLMETLEKIGLEPPILMGVEGETQLEERELEHLEGYEGSRPVRIGNVAYRQFQLDVYGILVDAIYYIYKTIGWISEEIYEKLVRKCVNLVMVNWKLPDHGMWEVRTEPKFFVESRMWCYVALDRGIKLAKYLGYDEDVERWEPVKKVIKEEILSKGWSEEKKAFTMYYGSDKLDATTLLIPLVKFLPATHPKVKSTIEKIMQELSHDGLVYRYHSDGVDGINEDEGAFLACSFWLVQCLIRLGRVSEAEKLFNKLIKLSNHLGLYSEEVDPHTGEALGNFPQAYTHMGLISAAVELDSALSKCKESR